MWKLFIDLLLFFVLCAISLWRYAGLGPASPDLGIPLGGRVPVDIYQRTVGALDSAGLGDIEVHVDGRDVTLFGEANEPGTATQALELVKRLPGVRTVAANLWGKDDDGSASAAATYNLTFDREGDQIRLAGTVPSEAQRDAIFDAAERRFAAVIDELHVVPGDLPQRFEDGWRRALAVVSHIDYGAAHLRDGTLYLNGAPAGLDETPEQAPAPQEQPTQVAQPREGQSLGTTVELGAMTQTSEPAPPSPVEPLPTTEAPATEAPTKEAAAPDTFAASIAMGPPEPEALPEKPQEAAESSANEESPEAADAPQATNDAPPSLDWDEAAAWCNKRIRQIIRKTRLRFRTGSALPYPDGPGPLNKLADIARPCAGFTLRIAGYTDSVGGWYANKRLSQRRANRVRAALIARGFDSEQLIAVGYGESAPIGSNDIAPGRSKNRRIEITAIRE